MRKIYIFIAWASLCLKRLKAELKLTTKLNLNAHFNRKERRLFKPSARPDFRSESRIEALRKLAQLSKAEIILEHARRRASIGIMSLLICCAWPAHVMAQANQAEKPVAIGAMVPDLSFNKTMNYGDTILKLTDFKGKAIIIDCWASWCTACIAAIPKVVALQNKHALQIQFILANVSSRDKPAAITALISKQKNRPGGFNIPIVIADEKIKETFPFQMLPHYIWISKEGKLVAVTGAEEINEHNIKNFLVNRSFSLPVKTK